MTGQCMSWDDWFSIGMTMQLPETLIVGGFPPGPRPWNAGGVEGSECTKVLFAEKSPSRLKGIQPQKVYRGKIPN